MGRWTRLVVLNICINHDDNHTSVTNQLWMVDILSVGK